MCTIDKMLIKGIRSFSPDNTAVITFFKPLTLIVGPNGAGKTTVIECLKHACTGELPPNSRSGQTFVHDPKVDGEVETKGQIKLRFRTAAGKDVVCIRSFQLTQKASKMEYKAIESVLHTINTHTGEKVCLSYRCADMDREVPILMGVSKAILENVIFVHQDEANWPLSEGSVLKKKFDDIFSATRYTKALEVMKKLYKDQAQLVKEYKLKLDHLQTIKDAAFKLQESIDRDREKVEELNDKMKVLESKLAEGQEQVANFESGLQQVRQLEEGIKVKEARRELLLRQKLQIYNDIEVENEDSDEELEKWHSNFESSVSSLRIKIKATESEQSQAKVTVAVEKEKHEKLYTVKGRLQAEQEAQMKDRVLLEELLASMVDSHGLRVSQSSSDSFEDVIERKLLAVKRRMSEMQQAFSQLQSGHQVELQRVVDERDRARSKLVEATGQVSVIKKQQDEKKGSLHDMEMACNRLEVSDMEMKQLEERERSAKERVERLTEESREAGYEGKLEALKAQHFTLSQRARALQKEKDAVGMEERENAALRFKREAARDKQAELNQHLSGELVESVRRACAAAACPVPTTPPEDLASLTTALQAAVSVEDRRFRETEEGARAQGEEVAGRDVRFQDAKALLEDRLCQIEEKRRLLSDGLFSALNAHMEADALEEQLALANKEAEGKKREHDVLDGMRRCFGRFCEMARLSQECPLCERPFPSPRDLQAFLSRQQTNQVQSADKLRNAMQQHQQLQARALSLDALRPLYLQFREVRDSAVPRAKDALTAAETNLAEARHRHELALAELRDRSEAVERLRSLETRLKAARKLAAEVEAVRAEVRDLEDRMEVRASGSQAGRGLDRVAREAKEAEEARDGCQARLTAAQDAMQKASEDLASSTLRWRNAREERMALAERRSRWEEAWARLEEGRAQLARLAVEERDWESSVVPVKAEIERMEQKVNEVRRQLQGLEREEGDRLRALERDWEKVSLVWDRLQAYRAQGGESQLESVRQQAEEVQRRVREGEALVEALGKRLAEEERLVSKHASLKRNIEDNLAYRRCAAEEAQAGREVEDLRAELLAGMGDGERVQRELRDSLSRVQEWTAELNRCQGSLQAHLSSQRQNETALRAPQYRDIETKYHAQLIQLKTTEMANRDMDKFHSALDRALMRFHSLKMEEINKVVRELWQQTYRGQDIESIQIRSDAEGAGARSYSYRVVMLSGGGGAELEMRGRCSAGQRVLASLVIRLALAETFCLNCGILALDEPTTNLDVPNADSLAQALLRIMEERRSQANFQLIVITHDERFAHMIGQKEHAQAYYRVSKDTNQHSKIELQDIIE